MKKALITFFVFLFVPALTFAGMQDKIIGAGFMLGEPTGLTLKKWLDNVGAIDGAVAWPLGEESSLTIQIGFLKHNFNEFEVDTGKAPFYYGAGTRLVLVDSNSDKDNRLGIRGIIGIEYIFENEPLEIFFELGPVLDVVPSAQMEITGGLGVRHYF